VRSTYFKDPGYFSGQNTSPHLNLYIMDINLNNYYTVIGFVPNVTQAGGKDVRLAVIKGEGLVDGVLPDGTKVKVLDHNKKRFIDDPSFFEAIEKATEAKPVYIPKRELV